MKQEFGQNNNSDSKEPELITADNTPATSTPVLPSATYDIELITADNTPATSTPGLPSATYDTEAYAEEIAQRNLSANGRAQLKNALLVKLAIVQEISFEVASIETNLLPDGKGIESLGTSRGGMEITLRRATELSVLILPRSLTNLNNLGITHVEAITRYHELLGILWKQHQDKIMGHFPFIKSLENIRIHFSTLASGYSGEQLIISFYETLGPKAQKHFKGALIGSTLLNLIVSNETLLHNLTVASKLLKAAETLLRAKKDERREVLGMFADDEFSTGDDEQGEYEDLDIALEEFANVWDEIEMAMAEISREGQERYFREFLNAYSGKSQAIVARATRILNENADEDYEFESTDIYLREYRKRKEKERKKRETERLKMQKENKDEANLQVTK